MKTIRTIATVMSGICMLLSGCGGWEGDVARLDEGGTAQGSALAAPLWDGDASRGTSNVWKVLNLEGDGTINVENDGTYGPVWKFYKPSGSHRTEGHGAKGFQAKEGDDLYLGWSSKLVMPTTLSTNAVFQWKAYNNTGSTEPMTQNFPIVISTANGVLHLMHYAPGKIGTEVWKTPLKTNTWNNFVLRIKVSKTASTGFIELWYNGVKQTLINGTTRYNSRTLDADYCDPKWGVYGGDDGTVTNYVRALRIASSYADAAPSTGNEQQVVLSQDCNHGGWSASFGVGSYRKADLVARGGVNDDASSIRVPSGLKVTLYEDDNFSGASKVLTADDSCLKGDAFNDTVSSLVVSTL